MTGIEQLRDWAGTMRLAGLAWAEYLASDLESVADQIKAEQEERVTRRLEDREAAEWVRAHGGLEKVKRQRMESVPREAYERKKERLMRHISECHDALRKRKQCIKDMERCIRSRDDERSMMHDEFEQMRLDHIEGLAFEKLVDDIAARLGISVMGFDSQDTRDRIMPVLDRRLMPEGMEWLLEVWPKWSNGEYCKFGDWWKSDKYGEPEPQQFRKLSIYTPKQLREWGQDDGDHFGYEWDFVRPSDPKFRPDKVEPPAPKVLDADGVEIRVGDTVWPKYPSANRNAQVERVEVVGIQAKYGRVDVQTVYATGQSFLEQVDADRLTHRTPVLAADGRPLREGETVWGIGRMQHEYVVLGQPGLGGGTGRFKVVCHDVTDDIDCDCDPSLLTHERPAFKCRDCAHWQKDPTADSMGVCWFYYHEHEGQDCYAARRGDIGACEEFMPRAEALAERDA